MASNILTNFKFNTYLVIIYSIILKINGIVVKNDSSNIVNENNNFNDLNQINDQYNYTVNYFNINNYNENDNLLCKIANENEMGYCTPIANCKAYMKIKENFFNLTQENVNFLKTIQCKINFKNLNYIIGTQICCPINSNEYIKPEIRTNNFVENARMTPVKNVVNKLKIKQYKRRIQRVQNSSVSFNNDCGKQISNRIYGGEIAELDEYPWMALLFYNSNEFGCSGALISSQFVLTAAHCVHGSLVREKKGLKNIRLGEFNVKTEPDCIEERNYVNCADAALDISVDKIIVHPDYDEKSIHKFNDIALIKLKTNVTFSHFIMPICLPNSDDDLIQSQSDNATLMDQIFWVSGWGRTDMFNKYYPNIRSPIKLKLSVPLVERENCSQILRNLLKQDFELDKKQLCAGGEMSKDTCAGDSGGPLMHFDQKKSRWVVYGIVSYGFTKCALVGHPAVYTNVLEYRNWITNITGI